LAENTQSVFSQHAFSGQTLGAILTQPDTQIESYK